MTLIISPVKHLELHFDIYSATHYRAMTGLIIVCLSLKSMGYLDITPYPKDGQKKVWIDTVRVSSQGSGSTYYLVGIPLVLESI
ncbi:MAG: hypothetical protein IPL46_20090 [Saprospiraceae bacterium]|nr:hypothetical protein [Saprospiraceae bacterium]